MPDSRVAGALQGAWLSGEVAVIGLARSGRAVASLLKRTGARVYASDAGTSPSLEATRSQLQAEGIQIELGRHDEARVAEASLVVVSPGVPPDAPVIATADRAGVEVVSEVEIALRFLPATRYIAITGTNGKTTTTALAAHILQRLGVRAVAAGNIGMPLAEIALRPRADQPGWIALEVSSYQLHATPGIRPAVGVLTNLSPNHLDRYRSVEEYYADKRLLFRNATPASQWVTNEDDPAVQQLTSGIAGVHSGFSTRTRSDAFMDPATEQLVALGRTLLPRAEFPLLGDHNVANALAASLAVMVADPAHQTADAAARIAEALRAFRALEHRIEGVAEIDGVLWINDSKSTNVASTLVALRGMTRPTILLLGGKHKGEPYTALTPELQRVVKRVIAYGEAAPEIGRDLAGTVDVEQGGTHFADVIARAAQAAAPGDVVLLSPACSSFDMFANYENRGNEFKRLVGQL
jgi:UDP-N-acetylmuramoylalanine--D-glutamate ligase